MKTKLFLLLLITIAAFVLPSCRKKGCGNPNAENYDSDKKHEECYCAYRFFTSADVNYFPFIHADGSPMDTTTYHIISADFRDPTILNYFGDGVSFDTVRYFCNSHFLSLPLKNYGNQNWQRSQAYKYKLYSTGGKIASGDINPFEGTSNGGQGKVTVHGQNGTIITFNYIVQ